MKYAIERLYKNKKPLEKNTKKNVVKNLGWAVKNGLIGIYIFFFF